MADFTDQDDQDELAKAFERPLGSGEQLPIPQPAAGMQMTFEGAAITAQRVAVPRNDATVLAKIKTLAAAASTDWFYRFPVKDRKTGKTTFIEGPSIKLANNVARLYGNCAVDCRVVDDGPSFMIYAKFADYESGFSLVRPFKAAKNVARIGGTGPEADARREDMALQIGVSKAERNVIVNGLELYCDYAFAQAQRSIVKKIEGNLEGYRQRAAKWFEQNDIELARVERAYGRMLREWLAPDLARIAAEVQAVTDGMALADDTWPREAPPEPRRDDVSAGAPPNSAPAQPEGKAAEPQTAATVGDGQPLDHPDRPEGDASPPKNWKIADSVMGQEAFLKALHDLLDMTESDADLDGLLEANALRIAKVTGQPMMQWRAAVSKQRTALKTAGGGDGPAA